jgi:hypothetical protein
MRKVIVGVVALLVWGVAIGVFVYRRAEDQRAEKRRSEARVVTPPPKPKLGPGRGEFDTYFDQRHPLSNKPEMMRRLSIREGNPPATRPGQSTPPGYVAASGDDYDITKEIFHIYVPPGYSEATPHGVIYYLGYKPTSAMPAAWQDTLDRLHLIFITPQASSQPDWQKAAIALDALHNLRKQYSLDEKRLYLFAFPDLPGQVGNQMTFGLADQYTGFVAIYREAYFRPVLTPGSNRYWPPQILPPPRELLATAMTRPYVFVQDPPPPDPQWMDHAKALAGTMIRDGFPRVMEMKLNDREEVHYPNFHGPWLERVIAFLDGSPTTAPAQ